jgi:TPR repeat protein
MAAEDSNFEDVLTLAAQGDLESIFSVGVHYLSGDGVTKKKEERRKKKEEAIKWLELAANSGP